MNRPQPPNAASRQKTVVDENKKGLLQNQQGKQQPLIYFVFMTHLKDVSRLKGAICGNPGLQAGGGVDQDIPSGRRHFQPGCFPCRRPMAATSAQFPGAAFQASAVLQTAWLVAFAPRPEGRGYRKVRLSGELCLSGESHSPDTGYLEGFAKRLLFAKKFCNNLFLQIFIA